MPTALGSGAGTPDAGASAPPALPVFEARESTANSAAPRNDNDTYFDNGNGAFHCETSLCRGSRSLDKTARPNRFFMLRHATSIQRINEGAAHGAGARGDAHAHESGLRSKQTPPECATTASLVAPEILMKVADVPVAMAVSKIVCIIVADAAETLRATAASPREEATAPTTTRRESEPPSTTHRAERASRRRGKAAAERHAAASAAAPLSRQRSASAAPQAAAP